jgi:hypothetical protein
MLFLGTALTTYLVYKFIRDILDHNVELCNYWPRKIDHERISSSFNAPFETPFVLNDTITFDKNPWGKILLLWIFLALVIWFISK